METKIDASLPSAQVFLKNIICHIKKQSQYVFYKKADLKYFAKFTGKHIC